MTTIIVLNAASSFLAMAGIGVFLAREKRRTRRVELVHVDTGAARPHPHR